MDVQRMRQLLDQRDEIDRELSAIVNGGQMTTTTKRPVRCSSCGGEGHTARACPQPPAPPSTEYANGAPS